MRKLKLSMETKYESGFSLYTPHSGVTCTEVPISLSLSLSLSLALKPFFLGLKNEESRRDRRGSEEDGVVFQAFFFLKGFLSTANSKPAQCLHGVV